MSWLGPDDPFEMGGKAEYCQHFPEGRFLEEGAPICPLCEKEGALSQVFTVVHIDPVTKTMILKSEPRGKPDA